MPSPDAPSFQALMDGKQSGVWEGTFSGAGAWQMGEFQPIAWLVATEAEITDEMMRNHGDLAYWNAETKTLQRLLRN